MTRLGWLSSTPASFRAAVLDRCVAVMFDAGETLYEAGDPAGGLYGLISGGLRVTISPSDRATFSVHFFVPGSWVGEAAAITGETRMVGLVATRPTHTLYLPLQAVNEIIRQDPDALRWFVRLTQFHLVTAIGAMGDLMLKDPALRLAAALLRLSGCRTETPAGLGPVDIDLSQDELGDMSNVGRTVVNANLRRLAREGWVELSYRRVRVLAPDMLRASLSR